MADEPDGFNETFEASARVALTAAGLMAERLARAHQQAEQQAWAVSEQEARVRRKLTALSDPQCIGDSPAVPGLTSSLAPTACSRRPRKQPAVGDRVLVARDGGLISRPGRLRRPARTAEVRPPASPSGERASSPPSRANDGRRPRLRKGTPLRGSLRSALTGCP